MEVAIDTGYVFLASPSDAEDEGDHVKATFLTIPRNIRAAIYTSLLRDQAFTVTVFRRGFMLSAVGDSDAGNPAILQVCKKLRGEALHAIRTRARLEFNQPLAYKYFHHRIPDTTLHEIASVAIRTFDNRCDFVDMRDSCDATLKMHKLEKLHWTIEPTDALGYPKEPEPEQLRAYIRSLVTMMDGFHEQLVAYRKAEGIQTTFELLVDIEMIPKMQKARPYLPEQFWADEFEYGQGYAVRILATS